MTDFEFLTRGCAKILNPAELEAKLKLAVGLQLTSAAPAGMAAHAATDASVQLLTEAAALLKRTLHPRPTLIANVHAELGRAFVTQSLRAAVGPWGGATTLNDATAAAAEAAAAGAARPSTPAVSASTPARPKSASFACPVDDTSTLEALRSRCVSPRRWA